MATFSQVQALADLASAAIADGDYAVAEAYLLRAQTLMVGIPDMNNGTQGQIYFQRDSINKLLASVRQSRAAAVGWQHSLLNYANPTT